MADIERRGNHTPRSTREQRAYRLVVGGGVAAVVAVVGVVLAALGIISGSIPVLAIMVLVACVILFRRAVN